MEHLWAPWRNRYVSGAQKTSANLFWEIGQSTDDAAHLVIARSKTCYAVLNRYPYNSGHSLVVPYRVVAGLEELSDGETLDLWSMVRRVTGALREAYQPNGFNIGMNLGTAAGAGIPKHLHVHVVPRWENDANFMTPLAETRIHPNDLETVHRTLSGLLSGPAA
ncbi:MAG: HIT domain-containing protein [Candidatus Methylacidiphilales bacterium]|nr:HIT domain-containing protein [Candidatus Methylacidiphilales bacterium]